MICEERNDVAIIRLGVSKYSSMHTNTSAHTRKTRINTLYVRYNRECNPPCSPIQSHTFSECVCVLMQFMFIITLRWMGCIHKHSRGCRREWEATQKEHCFSRIASCVLGKTDHQYMQTMNGITHLYQIIHARSCSRSSCTFCSCKCVCVCAFVSGVMLTSDTNSPCTGYNMPGGTIPLLCETQRFHFSGCKRAVSSLCALYIHSKHIANRKHRHTPSYTLAIRALYVYGFGVVFFLALLLLLLLLRFSSPSSKSIVPVLHITKQERRAASLTPFSWHCA